MDGPLQSPPVWCRRGAGDLSVGVLDAPSGGCYGCRECRIDAWALWCRIKVEGMPDTSKHEPPYRIPRQQESVCHAKPDASALARLLDEWMRGDESEQQETFEVLRRSLDEDRPDGYKFFS